MQDRFLVVVNTAEFIGPEILLKWFNDEQDVLNYLQTFKTDFKNTNNSEMWRIVAVIDWKKKAEILDKFKTWHEDADCEVWKDGL